jgi:hypothetical protein
VAYTVVRVNRAGSVLVEREVVMEEEVEEGIMVVEVGLVVELVGADRVIQQELFCRVNRVSSPETGLLE